MYNPGVGEPGRQNHASWLNQSITGIREWATMSNLTGLIGALVAIFCLLLLPNTNYWNIRLPLYLVIAIWTILRPRVALYLLPIAIPWGSLDSFNLGGLNLNSADILVALLAASWLMGFALRRFVEQGDASAGPLDREGFNLPRYLAIAMVLLLLAMLISMPTAFNLSSSLKELSKWLEAAVILLLGAQYIRTRRQVWILVTIIILAAVSQALLGYAQAFLNLGPEAFVRDAGLRVYGTFGQPNPYAGYINMGLSITAALALLARGWAIQGLAACATVLLALALYLSQSRGGEIAITAALFLIAVVGLPHLHRLVKLGGIGVLGVAAAYLAGLLPDSLLAPILRTLGLTSISLSLPSKQDFSTAERLAHWIAGIRMFQDHPFTGVGIGNYADAYPHYFITIFVNPLGHAHNYYINIAAEAGIFGLVTFLLFLTAVFIAGARSYQAINRKYVQVKQSRIASSSNPTPKKVLPFPDLPKMLTNDRALAVGLLAALLSVCVHNMVDNLYVHSMTILFSLLLVLVIRLEEMISHTDNSGGQFAYQ
ncbi:MAG TPA: O-antigen ligase family protein [Ktedonobacteraceae bacterium]|nr:O-antigen ligase family protein [Ktedonobacteraceae bacterium]